MIEFQCLRYNFIMDSTVKPRVKSYSVRTLMKMQKTTFQKQVQQLRKDYSNQNRFKEMKYNEKSKKKDKQSMKIIHNIGGFLEPTRIISLTAPKWAIFDFYSSSYIRGYRAQDPHSMNNFSKLLVFCTINALVIRHKIDMARFEVIVTKSAIKWANKEQLSLKKDQILSLEDALNLMMIQQSECYQLILGCNIGAYLQKKQKKQYYSVYDANDKTFTQDLKHFYSLVNSYCQFLNLTNVKYIQHQPALRNEKNQCSAYDIALLSIQCLKIPLFISIINKKQHNVSFKYIDDEGHLQTNIFTIYNKSIANPYISYSNVARNWQPNQFMSSNCSVYYNDKISRPVVIVLLASYSPNDREKDIQQVVEWYLKNQNEKQQQKQQTLQHQQKDERATEQKQKKQKSKTIVNNKQNFIESIIPQSINNKQLETFKIKKIKTQFY